MCAARVASLWRAQIEPLDVPNFKKNTVYIDNRALLEHLYRERFSYRSDRRVQYQNSRAFRTTGLPLAARPLSTRS